MTDLAIIGGIVAAIALVTWVLRARNGRVRTVDDDAPLLSTEQRDRLGAPDGPLLIELTAPACHTCAAARAVLERTAESVGGWSVVAGDVAEHMDLVRTHNVMRAPTTLVVDADARVRHAIGGVPEPDDLATLLTRAA